MRQLEPRIIGVLFLDPQFSHENRTASERVRLKKSASFPQFYKALWVGLVCLNVISIMVRTTQAKRSA